MSTSGAGSNSNQTLSNEVKLEDLETDKYYKLKKPISFQNPHQEWLDYGTVQEELNLLAKKYHRLLFVDDTTLGFAFLPGESVSVEQIKGPNNYLIANLPKMERDIIEIDLSVLPDGENTIFLKRIKSNLKANTGLSANSQGGARKKSVKRRKIQSNKSRKMRFSHKILFMKMK